MFLGGRVFVAGEVLLAAVREGVYRRSLSLAISDLRISLPSLNPDPGLRGAAYLVLDELFSRQHLGRQLPGRAYGDRGAAAS